MPKIVLVYPPMSYGKKRGFGFPPLGVLYLAAALKKKGVNQVRVIDAFIEGYTLEGLARDILNEGPDIVGFSSMTCQVSSVLDIAKELKRRQPHIKIAVGGPHISATKEELFSFTTDIDFLIYGEAEESFYQLVSRLEVGKFEGIGGLAYKKDNQPIINGPPQPINNLDEIPFPDLGLLNLRKYDSYYARSLPLAYIMGSRGCPFNCIYCNVSATYGSTLRLRSPQNIVDEMVNHNKRYGIRQFMFKDSTFTLQKDWVYEICSEIARRSLKINWTCGTRPNLVDAELLAAMKESGCYLIFFGIEAGTQKVLDALGREMTITQIKEGITLCKKAGIRAEGNFMVGSPLEKEGDARKTIKLAKGLGFDMVTFGVTVAYPGTKLYHWAVNNNMLPDKYWYMKRDLRPSDYNREVNGNLNLPGFPPDKQVEIAREADRGFYLRFSYILKSFSKIRGFYDIRRGVKGIKELLGS